MTTFQDLLKAESLPHFLLAAYEDYKLSDTYRTTIEAKKYWRNLNPTISRYQKLLYTISGRAVPDNFSANYKLASNVYFRFVTQTVQYLLGKGIKFDDPSVKKRLGGNGFDMAVQKALTEALNGGTAYGLMNYDKIEVFGCDEFIPLYDEETGSLSAGIRFWQLEEKRPLRLTLYEADGYTEYIKRQDEDICVYSEKRDYKLNISLDESGEPDSVEGENYAFLPIVPLYSPRKQSSIVGLKRQIDCYDLIESGFANDIDDASLIYWTISNAGGMDDIDLAKFVQHMKTVKAAALDDDGARAEAHTVNIPYQSREAMLERIEREMYHDFMVLNPEQISGGSSTATAIKAAYEPMNLYSRMIEANVSVFINGIMELLDLRSGFSFTRDSIVNELEKARTTQTKVSTALLLRELYGDDAVRSMIDDIIRT